ncbi:MAG: NADH dehydrogenase subunit [Chromatiales bacterium]|nr:NADH dehydrogenase subunit [Chromatiales bacterium]
MNALDGLFALAAATVVFTAVAGRHRITAWIAAAAFAAQFALLVATGALHGEALASALRVEVFGQTLGWRLDALGWFFAAITLGAAFVAALYAGGLYIGKGREMHPVQFALALNVLAMLMLVASADLLTLFVGWEFVSWASFLFMAIGGGPAPAAALRYLTYAIAGAMAILAGIALVWSAGGDLGFSALPSAWAALSTGGRFALVLLFVAGFGAKMGLLPLHLWQAGAYAHAPGPGAAFLGAISSRMGLFAMAVVPMQFIGLDALRAGLTIFGGFDLFDLFAWVAAATIILPTFTALRQNDARLLLAWHGIGQGGYMLLGLVLGDALGTAGGLMHVFNHATYQAALFMGVFAVMLRAGTADLNRLGGLVVRMPLTFLVVLVGIIGLAGLPPMNGFVSKWLIYRSLIEQGQPLLFVAAVIGTLGTILSVFKLLHNLFLGQLRLEHDTVREAPLAMLVPMLLLAVVVLVTGIAPGLVLDWVAQAQAALGLPVLAHHLGGIDSPHGSLNMLWVGAVLGYGLIVGAGVFYLFGSRPRRVHPLDNYAGGHFLTAQVRYQYSADFYAGLMHHIRPWYRGTFAWLESVVVAVTGTVARAMSGWYRNAQPLLYGLAFAVLALAWAVV